MSNTDGQVTDPKDLLDRIVFIKSWAYFVVGLTVGSIALFLGRVPDMILSVISGFFSLAGFIYYCIAVSRYVSGQRKHGVHLAIGSVLIIAYCCLIIIGKFAAAPNPPAA